MNAAWMLRRLQRMSVAEMLHRALRTGRHVVERRFPSLGRPPAPGHEALAERVWLLDLADREPIRRTVMERCGWSEMTARDLRAHRFSFFALERQDFGAVIRWNRDYKNGVDAPGGFGPLLDYRNSARFGDIKYLWEHNRHHHFVELAKAWYLTGDEEYASDVVAQLVSWLEECPYPRGVHWSSALESALRVINWVFALRFLQAGARHPVSLTDDILRRWLYVLHQHLWFIDRNLSRHSSANNHLIGEAAGLFIGALMVETPQSSRWLRRAKEILEREALAQVWADGVAKEQTTAYQTFVFDFLFIAARLGELNGMPFSRTYLQRLERMAEFVRALLDGNGEVPGIGDDDEGHVVVLCHAPGFRKCRSLVTAASLTFGRPDLAPEGGGGDEKTFWLTGRLGDENAGLTTASGPRRSVPDDFPDGGYFILRGADARVVFDCGPLGYLSIAAHGHADALSILLDHRGVPILVEPGTYVYHTDRRWRDYFRGTRAHSTVTVDALDQSVIGGSFLWLRHARAHLLHRSTGCVRGRHDGYTRLPDPVVHEREVRMDTESRTVVVTDLLHCSGEHSVEILWQLHPECRCLPAGRAVRIERGPAAITLEPDAGWGTVSLHAGESDPPLGWYSPGIDRKTAATAVRVAGKIRGTTTLRTTIHLL